MKNICALPIFHASLRAYNAIAPLRKLECIQVHTMKKRISKKPIIKKINKAWKLPLNYNYSAYIYKKQHNDND
jgi:hypothetical protein